MKTDVTFKLPEFEAFKQRAERVRDVCDSRVKSKGDTYLPKPNPHDESRENQLRYDAYKMRAVFVNFTGNTRKALVGATFRKDPEAEFENGLEYVVDDVDGAGNSIYQQSQKVLAEVLTVGRHALYVDYPRSEGSKTQKQMQDEGLRATIVSIDGLSVYNWRTEYTGSKSRLSLVVFVDDQQEYGDFAVKAISQRRVLRLVEGVYTVEIWRKSEKAEDEWYMHDSYAPKDGKGNHWDVIPFQFVGAENNDTSIDAPPLSDMAEINIAHYRNSADYEDSVYFTGQPQAWASGIDEEFLAILKKERVYVGSRTLFPVPPGEQFGFAQTQPNQSAKEAMDSKESQMAAIGARIISKGGAVKTATEAQNENEAEHSVLSLAVSNVSEAYVKCLAWVQRFNNSEGDYTFEINKDFTKFTVDAQLLNGFTSLINTGKWPESDFWTVMRKYQLIDADKTDEEIKGELESSENGLGLDVE